METTELRPAINWPDRYRAGWGQPGEFELNIGTHIAELTAGN